MRSWRAAMKTSDWMVASSHAGRQAQSRAVRIFAWKKRNSGSPTFVGAGPAAPLKCPRRFRGAPPMHALRHPRAFLQSLLAAVVGMAVAHGAHAAAVTVVE